MNMDLNKDYSNDKRFPTLHLPPVALKLREEDGVMKVFDPLRGKYVTLTPEEYVRQHFTSWLHDSLHYPLSLISNEIGIDFFFFNDRSATVIYTPEGKPLIIVEYKAPDVPVTQAVFDQIVRYNMTLKAKYLIVSNGINHYCCVIDYVANTYHFIPNIPDYKSLNSFSEN